MIMRAGIRYHYCGAEFFFTHSIHYICFVLLLLEELRIDAQLVHVVHLIACTPDKDSSHQLMHPPASAPRFRSSNKLTRTFLLALFRIQMNHYETK